MAYSGIVHLALISIFSVFILFPTDTRAQCNDQYLDFRTVTLEEPDEFLGNPESAAVLDNGRIVLSTSGPASVHLFDRFGQHITQVGQRGSGPFEYQNPSIVRAEENTAYVWDRQQLRLLAFGEDGSEIDEWTHFSEALADFDVEGDTLFGYRSGISSGAFIYGKELETGDEVLNTGELTDEHVVLSLLDGSGTLRAHSTRLYYASPAEASIYTYDIGSEDTQVYYVEDNDFDVDEFEQGISAINSDREAVMRYLMENSRFYKMNVLADGSLLAVLQHGNIAYDSEGLSNFDRALNVHHISEGEGSEACEQIELDIDSTGDNPIIGYTDHGLILLRTEQDAGDLMYEIYFVEADSRR